MKKIFLIILFLTFLININGFLYSQSKSKVSFFSPQSFYVYLMGSYNHIVPPDLYYLSLGDESANGVSPVFGLGYRFINIRNRIFINIEGDLSLASYDFDYYTRNQKINIYTLMLNIEGIFSTKLPLVFYGGIGVSFHRFSDLGYIDLLGDYISYGDDTFTVLAADWGVKIPISRRILIRTEFQWNGEVSGSDEYYDWYWDEYDNTNWDLLSSSFSVGIEFHF